MITFRKFYDDDFVQHSNPGKRAIDVYEMVDPSNEFIIRKAERVEDAQDYIDSFADSVDINLLLARFTAGDISAIPTADIISDIDISGIPDNYQEIHERYNNGIEFFNSLPDSIKTQFDNIDDFYNSDIDKLNKVFGEYNVSDETKTSTEPASNEA